MDRFKSLLSWTDKKGEINYFFIKKIEISNYIGQYDKFTTDLILYLVKNISNYEITTVVFRNVISIKLDLCLTQLTGLAIDDISNRGLETCNYRVYTYESGDINFSCEDIIIKTSDH